MTSINNKTKKENNSKDIIIAVALIVIITGLWYASWYVIDNYIVVEGELDDIITGRGAFGDKFGAINALFSGLAFAGIIFTIFLQKRELSLQREELEETRQEFIQQNETLKKQRFESTFFQLLNLHIEIIDKLKFRASFDQEMYENRDFFIGAIRELKYKSTYEYFKYSALTKLNASEISKYKKEREVSHDFFSKLEKDELSNLQSLTDSEIDYFTSEPLGDKEDNIKHDYENFFHKVQHNLGHYFRNIYHIFKYVHTTQLIDEEEKQFYCNIVRAQFSTDELVLIFYNCLTPIKYFSDTPNLGYPNFRYLIDKYDILQNMNSRLLLDKAHNDIFKKNKVQNEPETFKKINS